MFSFDSASFLQPFVHEQLLIEAHGQRFLAANRGRQVRKIANVTRVLRQLYGLCSGAIRSGRFGEVNRECGWLDWAKHGRAIRAEHFERAMRVSVWLPDGVRDDRERFVEFEDSDIVVVQRIVPTTLEERFDGFRPAENADDGINQMAALLEHGSARQTGPFGAAIFLQACVHVRADLENVAEPPAASGFEYLLESRVIAPLVADLAEDVLFARELHHAAPFVEH